MRSPAESVLAKADELPLEKEVIDPLLLQRKKLIGNIDLAMRKIKSKFVTVPQYTQSGDETLNLAVSADGKGTSTTRNIENIYISGKVARPVGKNSEIFPMYRVTREVIFHDGGSYDPHYEIAVADPDSKSGFSPLALIEQTVLQGMDGIRVEGSHIVDYDVFNCHDSLSSQNMQALHETGIYVNPHSEAMLQEVQEILGLAIENQLSQAA